MTGFILFIHIIACLLLIVVVLLQQSRGAGLSGVFGGGGAGSMFGGRGAAPFLTKVTTVFAVIFMLTSIILVTLSGVRKTTKSAIEKEMERTMGAPSGTETEEVELPIPAAPESLR